MKEQYIRQVKRALSVSRQVKREIARDLQEAFASALEHGESEAQVIGRLGSPRDFVESMEEQIGFDRLRYRKRKKLAHIICVFAIALASFVIYMVARALQIPQNAIGQAESMTEIQVEAPIDFMNVIVIFGMAALVVAVMLTVNYVRAKQPKDRKKA